MFLPHVARCHPRLFAFTFAVFFVFLQGEFQVSFAQEEGNSESANASANPVTINFDSLPTNIPLPPNQYQIATFMFDGQPLASPGFVPPQDVGGLRIDLAPGGAKEKAAEKIYKEGSKVHVKVNARNNTDQRVRIIIVDTYQQNRPRLLKDGKLVPYRHEVEKLMQAKDNDPEFMRPGSVVFLEPYSSRALADLNLSDWYAPLKPGLYRLTNRFRLDIESPWTPYSAEFVFEVRPE